MATIAELIIAASVDPSGIKTGLDRGAGYVDEFGHEVEKALNALPKGAALDGQEIAKALLQSASNTFRQNQVALKEAFFSGALSEEQFRLEGARNAEAFNASLVGGLKLLREEVGVRGSTDAGLSILESLSSKFMETGTKSGRAYNAGFLAEIERGHAELAAMQARSLTMGAGGNVASSMARLGIEGEAAMAPLIATSGKVASGISRIGIGAAFAAEQLMQGGEKGEGAMRRVLRATGVLGLAIGGPEGIMISALALGSAALMDYLHRTEREAEKTADNIRKHIAQAANAGKFDDLRTQARIVENGLPYKEDGTPVALSSRPELAAQGVRSGALRDLEAQKAILDEIVRVRGAGNTQADRDAFVHAREGLNKLIPLLNIARSTYAGIQGAIQNLQAQEADNAGRATPIEITALSPDAKAKRGKKEGKPFADLTAEVGELTRAIDLAEQHGERAGAAIYEKLIAKRAEIADKLRTQAPGSEGRNELLAADNDAMNALGLTTDKLIDRLQTMRTATGAWSAETSTAAGAVQRQLEIVNAKITAQGGASAASNALLTEQARLFAAVAENAGKIKMPEVLARTLAGDNIAAEVARQHAMDVVAAALRQSGAAGADEAGAAAQANRERLTEKLRTYLGVEQQTNESAADYEARMEHIAELWKLLTGHATDAKSTFNEIATSIHGIVDALAGMGVIGPGVTQAANGALHAAEAIKKMREASEAKGGLDTIDAIAGTIGAAGGIISAVSALTSLFAAHDAIMETNNARLTELRAALTEQKGIGGQADLIAAIEAALNTPGIHKRQSNGMPYPGEVPLDMEVLKKVLAGSGITIDEFTAAAKAAGITFDGTESTLKAFEEALKLTVDAQKKFSQSIGDQTSLEDLRRKVYGLTAPIDALKSSLTLLTKFSPAIGKEFGLDGIDATTKDGQEKLRKALEAMYDKLASGTMTPEELDKFGGAKDFAAWLASASDALAALDKNASAAAGAMLYVPTGYKLALDRFNAIDPVSPQPFTPSGRTEHGGGSTTGPGGTGWNTTSGGDTYQFNGPIMIDARSLTPEQLLAAVLKQAQRTAATTFGDSSRWREIQKA